MNDRIKNNAVNHAEIISFIKEWLINTNPNIMIGEVEIENKRAVPFFEQFLSSFMSNRKRFRITGADRLEDFEINIANFDALSRICKDLWENSEKYYDLRGEDSYYGFLKYLWIEYPSTEYEISLAEFIHEYSSPESLEAFKKDLHIS